MNNGDRFFGKYRGQVISNIDPMQIGRLLVQVPDVSNVIPSTWAMPCFPVGGKQMGAWWLPQVGAGVWIEFEQGDPDYPIWTGCWFGSVAEMPSDLLAPPYKKVLLMTEGGHSIVLDDTPGIGGITLKTSGGQKIVMNATGIEIDNGMGAKLKMTGPQVSINDGALDVI